MAWSTEAEGNFALWLFASRTAFLGALFLTMTEPRRPRRAGSVHPARALSVFGYWNTLVTCAKRVSAKLDRWDAENVDDQPLAFRPTQG
ncbi:MAG: hypothetical protein JOZ69_05095 [Myxococcales bacterium]|nr:hypothetical protein [Myxococcales bacterium]